MRSQTGAIFYGAPLVTGLLFGIEATAGGPSLNILIKLSAILSLVFVPFFVQYGGILKKLL